MAQHSQMLQDLLPAETTSPERFNRNWVRVQNCKDREDEDEVEECITGLQMCAESLARPTLGFLGSALTLLGYWIPLTEREAGLHAGQYLSTDLLFVICLFVGVSARSQHVVLTGQGRASKGFVEARTILKTLATRIMSRQTDAVLQQKAVGFFPVLRTPF